MHIKFPRNEESVARSGSESIQTTKQRDQLRVCCFHMWTDARIVRGYTIAE